MTTFTMQDLTINNLPTTPEEDEAMETLQKQMGEVLPKSQVNPEAVIDEMLYTIKQSLLLLVTVISQAKAQPDTTPPEGNQSLQETIALTLQQADWLKEMVQEAVEESIDRGNFEDAVSSQVSSCVDSYFCHEFSLDDHCDVNEMVNDAVSDKIEEVVAEKLSEASVSISF